jgi:hypothetical protein
MDGDVIGQRGNAAAGAPVLREALAVSYWDGSEHQDPPLDVVGDVAAVCQQAA